MATLRTRTSEKWRLYPEDVLPLFVAEMDYPLAPAIKAVLHAAIDNGDAGYVSPRDLGAGAAQAFADFAGDTWGWSPATDRIGITTDVSVVIVESLRRLIKPGDGVIVNPPIYPPFFDLIPEAGGVVVDVPLLDDGTDYRLDLDGIDRALEQGARGVLLCNPHNPVGLLHTRADLEALSQLVAGHDGFVLSDEIHAPLTHAGQTFTPYLTVSDQAREHGIAAASASKAFNLAGLKSAFFVTESARMDDLVKALPAEVTYRTGLFGLLATKAGFNDGRDWLRDTIAAVEANLDLLERQLAEQLPQVKLRRPQSSYLAWLDMRALDWGDDPAARVLEQAKVALSSGPAFAAPGYARMNVACAPETVTEAVTRIARLIC